MFRIPSFFPFLNFWLAPLFGMFFAAGDVLGALGDIGAQDAGVVGEGLTEGTEGEGAPVTEPDTEGARAAEGDPGDETAPEGTEPAEKGPQLAKPLSKGAKAFLQNLKKSENPEDRKVWKEISSRVWGLNNVEKQIAQHFPDGIEAAVQRVQEVDNFLSENEFTDFADAAQELDGYRGIDRKLLAGDVSFVNDLPEEMQTGLYQMMPQFIDNWSRRDKPGFDHYFGPVVLDTLDRTRFDYNLELAARDLERMGLEDKDVKGIFDLVSGLRNWIKQFRDKIAQGPDKKQTPTPTEDPKFTEREQRVQAAELQQSQARVAKIMAPTLIPKAKALLAKAAGGKIPAYVNVGMVMQRAFGKDCLLDILGPGISKRLDQYMAAKDENGAARYYLQQITEDRLEKAVSRAYKYIYRGASLGSQQKPKPGAQPGPGTKANGGAPTSNANAGAGWVKLPFNPKLSITDAKATRELAKKMGMSYEQLIFSNRAVKDGRKVTWDAKAPNEE